MKYREWCVIIILLPHEPFSSVKVECILLFTFLVTFTNSFIPGRMILYVIILLILSYVRYVSFNYYLFTFLVTFTYSFRPGRMILCNNLVNFIVC